MIAWVGLLPLKAKLWALAVGGVLLTVGVLWVRWRLAQAGKAKAEARAAALEAARRTEQRILTRRQELAIRQRLLREQIAARTERDHFQDGYGP